MNNDLIYRSVLINDIEECAKHQVFTSHAEREEFDGMADFAISMAESAPDAKIDGNTSDGFHTFNELYHHRAVLFSVIVKAFPDKAWKAKKHHDGSMFDGMFIVGIETPRGQATYHYDVDPYWELFGCKELDFAPEWDGHTPAEAIERIRQLEPVRHGRWEWCADQQYTNEFGETGYESGWKCSVCGEMMTIYTSPKEGNGLVDDPIRYAMCRTKYCWDCGAKMESEV